MAESASGADKLAFSKGASEGSDVIYWCDLLQNLYQPATSVLSFFQYEEILSCLDMKVVQVE